MNHILVSGFICVPPYYQNVRRQGEDLGYCRLVVLVPRDESRMSHANRMKPTKDRPGDVVRVVVYGKGATSAAAQAKLGMKVSVSGWLETRRYRLPGHGTTVSVSEIHAEKFEFFATSEDMPSDRASTMGEYSAMVLDEVNGSTREQQHVLPIRPGTDDEWMFYEGGYVP